MLTRGDRVTVETTSFFAMLRTVGIRNIVWKNIGFYIALLTSFATWYYFKERDMDYFKSSSAYIGDTIASVSGTLLGIILAGLAIIVAIANGKILHLLLANKMLQKILTPFWLVSVCWGLSTFICILINFVVSMSSIKIVLALTVMESFIFMYSLCGTINLIGNTIRVMVIIADLIPEDS